MHRRLLYLILAFLVVGPCYGTTADGTTDKTTSTETTTDQAPSSETTITSTTIQKDGNLDIYFINDLHYHILPLDSNIQPRGNGSGGLARLRKTVPEGSIFINAGHSLDGELFNAFGFSAFEAAAKVLKFSAQVPSEDLYHFGLDAARDYISSQESNMVCANVDTKKDLIEVTSGDCTISIIGFVEKKRIDSLNLTGLPAEDEKTDVEAEVLKAKGDIIIVVGSSSLDTAMAIANITRVNLVLVSNAAGNDTHDMIWKEVKANETYVASLVVNDGKLDSIFRVGRITFTVEDKCKVKSIHNEHPLNYTKSDEGDEGKAEMELYLKRLEEEFTTSATLNCTGLVCQTSECAAGSLVADAVVLYLAKDHDPKMPKLALVPGRIFSKLLIKDIVKGIDLYKMVDNSYLCSVKVNGSALKKIFEWSVANYTDSLTPLENYLQISEFFRVVYDLKKGKGNRVQQLQVYSANTEEWRFEDVSDDKSYDVVITVDLMETIKSLDLLNESKVLEWHIFDALHYYLYIYGKHLQVPPLGQRIQYSQNSPEPGHECSNNTGEVIALTLLVVGLLTGLGMFLWKYVYPRYRSRRDSTTLLVS